MTITYTPTSVQTKNDKFLNPIHPIVTQLIIQRSVTAKREAAVRVKVVLEAAHKIHGGKPFDQSYGKFIK
jgi:hypothetical protein